MTQHTQEAMTRPWRIVGPTRPNAKKPCVVIAAAGTREGEKSSAVCRLDLADLPNAELIISAVNACAGMADPACEIALLRSRLKHTEIERDAGLKTIEHLKGLVK